MKTLTNREYSSLKRRAARGRAFCSVHRELYVVARLAHDYLDGQKFAHKPDSPAMRLRDELASAIVGAKMFDRKTRRRILP